MAEIRLSRHLARAASRSEYSLPAVRLSEVFERLFELEPTLRSYVLDDQGHLRPHVVVFIDGAQMQDRTDFDQALTAASCIDLMQALSGG